MKAAIVTEAGKAPVYGDFREPVASADENLIAVKAASLNPLTRGRASGQHYSSSGRFPFVAGVDGVGRTEDGSRVYFALPTSPFGSMAEKAVARKSHCIAIPDRLDDIVASAIANPGMSSWAALKERAKFSAGETVLINGATGTSGRLAVQIAKYMGAKKVIATGRNVEVLNSLRGLGADVVIPLAQDEGALEEAFKEQFQDRVDIVLDYLWGNSAEKLLAAGAKAGEEGIAIRFIHIGSSSGAEITLPGAVLRSTAIQLMGSGIGSISVDRLLNSIGELFVAASKSKFETEIKSLPLKCLEEVWSEKSRSDRIVFTVG
jgi:NADPH:quinone reductase-like Zn-dependent oxidoreductase